MSLLTEALQNVEKHVVEREIGGQIMRLETGEVAKQAGGSVVVTVGETVVLVTASANASPREGIDFFPLTVDYEERMYAAGKIPGGWIKREGRPPERTILTSRLIDRPCRPLFPEGFRNDVHIVGLCTSVDGENNPDVLALTGAGAALSLSDIPFDGPVAGVRVGYVDGEFLINPTESQMAESQMNLVVAGTRHNLNMVECGCEELSEEILVNAFEEAHRAIREILDMIDELVAKGGKPKAEYPVYTPSAELDKLIRKYLHSGMAKAMRILDKQERESAFNALKMDALKAAIQADASLNDEERASALALTEAPGAGKDFGSIAKRIKEEELMTMIVEEGIRPDGRRCDEIRPIWGRVGVLPRPHGTGLFTRGQTQALSVVTLGTLSEEQSFDNVIGEVSRRYMHHYNFPPFSVGEARFMRGPGRREIGHGALAERALLPVIPSEDDFPYTIRVVSDILESNGSSSMASTCGSTLALMDAGVPLRAPVAGIAMGLVMKGERFAVLTDIQGMEDAFGEMDFKVTGTREGVTALQMDIKLKGVTMEILGQALDQARDARFHILDIMEEIIPAPRTDLSKYAPKVQMVNVSPDRIKDIIGPGGKVINKIIAETGAKIDIENDGRVFVAAVDRNAADKALKMIEDLTRDVEAGEEYAGKVMRIMDFGAFVEILPGREGLVHVSKLMPYHVRKVDDVVKVGDEIRVRVEEIDSLGRINLTRRGLWTEEEMTPPEGYAEQGGDEERPRRSFGDRNDRGDRGDRGPRRDDRGPRRDDRGPRRDDRGPRRDDRGPRHDDRAPRADQADRGPRHEDRPAPRHQDGSSDERPAAPAAETDAEAGARRRRRRRTGEPE